MSLILPILASCLMLAAYAGLTFAIQGLPAIIPMLLPFYLPFALTTEQAVSIRAENILFNKKPLVTTSRPIVRNWAYALYALCPAITIILLILNNRTTEYISINNPLCYFSYVFIAIYSVFLLLALLLGKLQCLKPGRFILSMTACLLTLAVFHLIK